MMDYSQRTIAGVELLARFSANGECLDIGLVFATIDGGIAETQCLVPHGMKDLDWRDFVPEIYKLSAIQTLESWLNDGLLEPKSWEPRELYYSPEFRGFASFWRQDQCVPISTVNLVDAYCNSCGIYALVSGGSAKYFTPVQELEWQTRQLRWRSCNVQYLDQKAQEFASFWASQVGCLGSASDGLLDMMHALQRSGQRTAFSESDSEKLYKAFYNYANDQFAKGQIPYVATDYSPDHRIIDILDGAGLLKLAKEFPWKTQLHLNFDDCDRSALFEA